MFETVEEKNADIIFSQIDDKFKHMIADAVQAACIISQNVIDDTTAPGIPRTKWFNTACNLGYVISTLLTKMIDENNLPIISFSEDRQGHGRPIIHFHCGNAVMHIKKNDNKEKLPAKARFRKEEAKNNVQLTLNFDGIEESKPCSMIITFSHKRFRLKYVQIGIPDENYERWLRRWSLMEYISRDNVENIVNEYKPELLKQIAETENIKKKYSLEVRA